MAKKGLLFTNQCFTIGVLNCLSVTALSVEIENWEVDG